jgi:hypothetical protein
MRFSKKALIATGTGAVVAMAVGGLALAYWTTTGSGTGSGTAASSNGTVVLHASFASGITPGGSKTVSFTADNAGTSGLQVGTVSTVVTASGTCDASWFSVPDVAENQTIAAGASGVALANTGTLSFTDAAVNQDSCKGATLTLTLSSN